MSLKFLFVIVVIFFHSLAAQAAVGNVVTASGWWENLVSTVCWIAGIAYLITACVKFFRILKKRPVSLYSAAAYLFSSYMLLSLPFVQGVAITVLTVCWIAIYSVLKILKAGDGPIWLVVLFFLCLPWAVDWLVSRRRKKANV